MNAFRLATVAVCAAGLCACASKMADPVALTEQGNVSTSLYFPGAPAGARVLVDGADAGEALLFDGRKTVLTVAPGNHRVVVQAGGPPALYDRTVFVGAGSRLAIKVR